MKLKCTAVDRQRGDGWFLVICLVIIILQTVFCSSNDRVHITILAQWNLLIIVYLNYENCYRHSKEEFVNEEVEELFGVVQE